MDHAHRVDIPLVRHVEVSQATQFLLQQLGCEGWYVACHHEDLFVFRLTKHGQDRYALSFQCTPPIEKGVYHGSKAWALSIIPLRDEFNLAEDRLQTIRSGVAACSQGQT
jgi:hypothetical protein